MGLPSLYEAAQDGLSETVSSEAAVWEAAILAKLPGHRLVAKRQLVGIMLFVLVAEKHLPNCAAARVTQLGTGPLGAGNKGAAAASLILYGSTLCIIGAHLAAGSKGPSARNKDTQQILAGLSFPRSSQAAASSSSSEGGGDAPPPPALPSTVDAHDFIIWCGDLNYRLSMKDDDARAIAQAKQWQSLMGSDELRLSQLSGAAWAGFSEGDMRFPPTYKYDTHSDGMRGRRHAGPPETSRFLTACACLCAVCPVRLSLSLSRIRHLLQTARARVDRPHPLAHLAARAVRLVHIARQPAPFGPPAGLRLTAAQPTYNLRRFAVEPSRGGPPLWPS